MLDKNGIEYGECMVGNIIGNHIWGEKKEIKSGTKHLGAGTKVYCLFIYGGMGHEHVSVMGKPRKSFRMIDVIIRTAYIKNFRLQKIYEPQIIKFIKKYNGAADPREIIQWSLKELNEGHAEIREQNRNH